MKTQSSKNRPFIFLPFFLAALILLGTGCKNNGPDTNDDPIVLDCSISEATTLSNDPDKAVDYIVPCVVSVSEMLTIEAGTVIQFESDAGFDVDGANAAINALGTSAMPITFEGVSSAKGSWRGIFIGSNNVNNQLDHVIIDGAGGNSFNSNDDRGSIVLYADGRLSLTNSTLRNGLEYGLNCNYSGINLNFANNTIAGHDKAPVLIPFEEAHELDGASLLEGNSRNYVEVWANALDEEVTWTKLSVPYRVVKPSFFEASIEPNGGLTLSEGVQIEFGADNGIQVDGYLAANGTATNPVTMTGTTAIPGAWKGLIFLENNVNSQLDHVEIAYAGGGQFNSNGDLGSVIVWADAYLSITNSVIRDGDAPCGINATYSGETLITTGTTFTNITTDICQ